mgnify:CR=1 FL=1
MKKKAAIKFLLLAFMMMFVGGCASLPVRFTDMDEINGRSYEELPRVTASATTFALFDVFPIGATNREAKIKNRLLEEYDADALIDVEIYSRHTWVVIGVRNTLIVSATPIRFTDGKSKKSKKSKKSGKKKKSKSTCQLQNIFKKFD